MQPKNDYLLKTGDACSAARLDRNRFNEAIKAGAIDFAPDVEAGKARYFDENAEIGLYMYARLTERGLNSSRAGTIANEVHRTINGHGFGSAERYVAVCYSLNGSFYVKTGAAIAEIMASGQTLNPFPYEIALYDLDNIRHDLLGTVNYLRRVVGGAEE